MGLSGFSSPRFDCFPAGLRVLVVDDDATWLKILEKMLKKCNYEVTTCNLARDALNLLRERKNAFDIVISDVTMPDMDGFKLLEHIGLEMDLPIIMMSVDGETSRVMKGVQHGACDYLLKPIRMKELRNIWQHVYRKRMNEVRDAVDVHDSNLEELHLTRRHHGHEQSDDVYVFAQDLVSGKRRKYADNSNGKNGEVRAFGDSQSAKRVRVVWTVDLHQKFVRAVNQIGFEKVGPKKILDLMGVPWLTRENVASHLQKYRLYLSRLEKEDELKETYSDDFDPGQKISSHSCDPKFSEPNVNRAFPVTVPEPETSLIQDRADISRNITSSSPSFNQSTDALLNPSVRYESNIQHLEYSWSPEISSSLEPDHKTQLTAHHTSDKPVVSSNKLVENVVTQVKNTSALFSIQSKETPLRDFPETEKTRHSLWTSDVKSSQANLILDTGSSINLWDEEFETYSSHVDLFPHIDDLTNIQSLGHSSQERSGGDDTQHTEWSFDCEYPNESVEYPTIDKGLFVYSLT